LGTIAGGLIELSLEGDLLRVEDATVIEADIQAVNGVIHVVDTVMIPEFVDVSGGA